MVRVLRLPDPAAMTDGRCVEVQPGSFLTRVRGRSAGLCAPGTGVRHLIFLHCPPWATASLLFLGRRREPSLMSHAVATQGPQRGPLRALGSATVAIVATEPVPSLGDGSAGPAAGRSPNYVKAKVCALPQLSGIAPDFDGQTGPVDNSWPERVTHLFQPKLTEYF